MKPVTPTTVIVTTTTCPPGCGNGICQRVFVVDSPGLDLHKQVLVKCECKKCHGHSSDSDSDSDSDTSNSSNSGGCTSEHALEVA